MSCTQSILDGITLPLHFKYKIPKPLKRVSIQPTAGGINIQQAPTRYIEDNIIPWNLDAVSESVKDTMLAFYEEALSPEVSFTGHNQPSITYTVRALRIDDVEVKAGLWYLSGSLQVINIVP